MALPQILVDSSFLYALLDVRNPKYSIARSVVALRKVQMLVPYITLSEAAFLFNRAGGVPAVMRFLDALVALQPQYETVTSDDLTRAREIMGKYLTAKLDFVDCCIMALSERLNITQVCTFDHRDFGIFRPKHCDRLEILP